MSLDHGKVFYFLRSNPEFHSGADGLKIEKFRTEVISNSSHSLGYGLTNGFLRFFYFEKNIVIFTISNLEVDEFDVVDVGRQGTQELFSGLGKTFHILWCLLMH